MTCLVLLWQIAPEQLLDLGLQWVILGHSERRSLLKESNEFVGEKTANALAQGLKVIACIGETLEQRESDQVGFQISCVSQLLKINLQHGNASLCESPDGSCLLVRRCMMYLMASSVASRIALQTGKMSSSPTSLSGLSAPARYVQICNAVCAHLIGC